ncbi:MAG: nitrate reductase [Oscillospiraceae bacterium]|nr:nitrate reductase [Oscillospiraceae bacterium]
MAYVQSGTGVLKQVMLARPEYVRLQPINVIAQSWVDRGAAIDAAVCLQEHDALVQAYRENGVAVHLAPTDPALTNQTFARDFGACVAEGYVLGRFKEPVRTGETALFEAELQALGVPCAARCEEGVFEGGDFWFLDARTLAVGLVARTDAAGFRSLADPLTRLGYELIPVSCAPSNLHLDMCFNVVADRLAVLCEEALPPAFLNTLRRRGFRWVPVTQAEVYRHHANLQSLGRDRVLSFAENTAVNERLRAFGLTVIELPLREILKMGGGPHCMTFPIRRAAS